MSWAKGLPMPPESGLAKELFDLVAEMAADHEINRINNEERRRRVAKMFAIARSMQVIEAGGSVYNAATGETWRAAQA